MREDEEEKVSVFLEKAIRHLRNKEKKVEKAKRRLKEAKEAVEALKKMSPKEILQKIEECQDEDCMTYADAASELVNQLRGRRPERACCDGGYY